MKKIPFFAIILFLIAFSLNNYPLRISEKKDIVEDFSFSEDRLIEYIIEKEICYPKVVYAQARIETGNFTSRRFVKNNNLFGMKMPKKRETKAIGVDNDHSIYNNWKEAVDDYKLWQDHMIHRTSDRNEYISYLGRNYATDKRYTLMIKQIIK